MRSEYRGDNAEGFFRQQKKNCEENVYFPNSQYGRENIHGCGKSMSNTSSRFENETFVSTEEGRKGIRFLLSVRIKNVSVYICVPLQLFTFSCNPSYIFA